MPAANISGYHGLSGALTELILVQFDAARIRSTVGSCECNSKLSRESRDADSIKKRITPHRCDASRH